MNDVYLHIGPVKTGSTYLQGIVWKNRHALREHGVLLPAGHDNELFLAANDVQDGRFVLIDLPEGVGAWRRVAKRARSWPGPVLITCELLGFSEPDHIQRIAASLAPSVLHLIVMARCRADLLPSLYQEQVKMVDPDQSWPDFLRTYRAGHDSWPQAPGALVQRWLPHIGPQRVHVITVPKRGAGRHVLLHRFAEALGADPAWLPVTDASANTSLDAVEIELLRAVTARTSGRLDRRAQRTLINDRIVPLLRHARRARRPYRLPASFRPLMTEAGARDVEAIAAAGCHVHGDLNELLPDDGAFDDGVTAGGEVPEADVLTAAVDALVAATEPAPAGPSGRAQASRAR